MLYPNYDLKYDNSALVFSNTSFGTVKKYSETVLIVRAS